MEVVVGFIPTAEGWAAVHAAVSEAVTLGARMLVVNASRGDAPSDLRRVQQGDLEQLGRVLQESGVDFDVVTPSGRADAATVIMETARERGAARIVIGVRQRTSVGKLILGSTAQRVILGAPCPVLAVRP